MACNRHASKATGGVSAGKEQYKGGIERRNTGPILSGMTKLARAQWLFGATARLMGRLITVCLWPT
jgi:hypothetical protein